MKSPNEFWLSLHTLSAAYMGEGMTPQARADEILSQFLAMPSIARRELLDDLLPVAQNLPGLYAQALAAHRRAETDLLAEKAG